MSGQADGTGRGVIARLRNALQARELFSSLTAGLLLGITEIVAALSFGSLIFSGELAPYLPYGMGMALAGAAALMIGTSLISRMPGMIPSAQDSPAVLLAVIAAGLAASLSGAQPEVRLITVLVAIAVTSLMTGLFLLALGFFKLGALVRYVPYPVVGGFLAGTGWLLVQGSFGVVAGYPLTLANLPLLLAPNRVLVWAAALLLALGLFFGLRRFRHFLTLPAILAGAVGLFYLALLITGTSLETAAANGILMDGASRGAAWEPLRLRNLLAANWTAILGQGGHMATVLALSVISLLLNASALELATRRDADLNHELKAAGLGNILSGMAGGMVGYHTLSLSALSYQMGGRGRLPGLAAGAVCAAALVVGSNLFAFIPMPVLGGLLMYLGIDFLYEWVIRGWARLSRAEYAAVLLILAVIGATDFLVGVGVGLLAMILIFVLSYSGTDPVRITLAGTSVASNVWRSAQQRQALRELGRHVYVVRLQGFLFFGTAYAVLDQIRSRLDDGGQPAVRHIIVDLGRVTGLDSSAMMSFLKARQLAEGRGISLSLSDVSGRVRRQFEAAGLLHGENGLHVFADLDRALEWSEDQLLASEHLAQVAMPATLRAQLEDGGFPQGSTDCLMRFLETVTVEAGDYLVRQGDESHDLYFLEQGEASIYLELEGDRRARIRSIGPGMVIGELGFYVGSRRTASVTADSPAVAYRLTRVALAEMQAREPELAAAFQGFMVRLLAEKLVATTQTLETVLR